VCSQATDDHDCGIVGSSRWETLSGARRCVMNDLADWRYEAHVERRATNAQTRGRDAGAKLDSRTRCWLFASHDWLLRSNGLRVVVISRRRLAADLSPYHAMRRFRRPISDRVFGSGIPMGTPQSRNNPGRGLGLSSANSSGDCLRYRYARWIATTICARHQGLMRSLSCRSESLRSWLIGDAARSAAAIGLHSG